MANQKKITQSKFNAVKTLLKGGASVREIMEYMELSDNTIYMIKAAETLAEYENMIAEKYLAAKKARTESAAAKVGTAPAKEETKPVEVVKQVQQTVTIQATHYMMQEMQETNKLLKTISAKLAFIVDELCGTTGTKEG